MKNHIKYIKQVGIFVLALFVVSCTEFKEYESTSYGPGPTVSIAPVAAQDSALTISVTSDADGSASVILLAGSGNTPPEDPADLATGNISAMDFQAKHVVANTATNFSFDGLVQDATYEVMAVGTNLNGKYSEVVTLAVATDDSYPPVLLDTDPGVGYDPVLPVDGSVVLYFDEPVLYDDTKDLVFTELFDGADVLAGSVTVDGSEVTVALGENLTNRDYVLLSYPEGAFTDLAGNLAAGVESYVDGDQLVGLFWRAETKDYDAVTITPEEAVVPAGFDIVVSFAEEVDIEDVADGDITLTYDDGRNVLIRDVLVSELSATGNDLTITQSYAAAPGMVVTLDIPSETLSVGYGNPNAEVTASWTVALTLADLVGNYTVEAVSYIAPGTYDEVWAATVELVPGNDTALSITINAGYGGGVAFLAKFDVDLLEISIPEASNAGNLYGWGATLIIATDLSTYAGGPVTGTINSASSFTINELGMYLAEYDNGDGSFGAWWDAFDTNWTKSALKAMPAATGVNPEKAARFK